MKYFLLISAVVCFANCLEREQGFGVAEFDSATSEVSPEDVAVTSEKSNVNDDNNNNDDDDIEETFRPTQCSTFLCSAMCGRYGCQDSTCLSNNRCGCVCARQVTAHDYFRNLFGRAYTPRYSPQFPAFPQLLDFTSRFEDRWRDISKFIENFGNSNGMVSRVYYTNELWCESAADCSAACPNCTSVNCSNNFCQCMSCSVDGSSLDSRSSKRPQQTCLAARDCEEICTGCSKIGCRFRSCQCDRCQTDEATTGDTFANSTTTTTTTTTEEEEESSEATTEAATEATTEATTEAATEAATEATTEAAAEAETSTVSVDIFSVRPSNQTNDDITLVNGKCAPKRCNHACWERQCSKWNCVNDSCQCDGCPEDLAVMVRNSNGKPAQPEDSNKYEIIF